MNRGIWLTIALLVSGCTATRLSSSRIRVTPAVNTTRVIHVPLAEPVIVAVKVVKTVEVKPAADTLYRTEVIKSRSLVRTLSDSVATLALTQNNWIIRMEERFGDQVEKSKALEVIIEKNRLFFLDQKKKDVVRVQEIKEAQTAVKTVLVDIPTISYIFILGVYLAINIVLRQRGQHKAQHE